MIKPLFACTIAVAVFSGCAGYNSVLFTTKSNVGLDFDSAPPTAEITVSRKEAVIAPGFENGKTPPVMASFKPRTGFVESFKNFGLGVDQTFAGGDAAVAMSKYYNRKDTPTDNPAEYNSTLTLEKKPEGMFRKLSEPGKTRPFVFGTDTMLGLKVAWSGAAGQFPDSVKAGFNRKEFAWAPIGYESMAAGKVGVKMPSFLATIESGIKAGETNLIESLQYFATGDAATQLTRRPEVRSAMVNRLDPNAKKLQFADGANIILGKVMAGLYSNLETLSGGAQPDPMAQTLLARLNSLKIKAPATWAAEGITHFRFNPASNPPISRPDATWPPAATPYGNGFQGLIAYRADLENSYSSLKEALGKQNTVFHDAGGNVLSDAERKKLPEKMEALKTRLDTLNNDLASSQEVLAAYSYVRSLLTVD